MARPSTGDSGNIAITAPSITVSNGAYLLADATAGHAAGDITLTADAPGGTAAISLGSALVAGRNIALLAGQGGDTEVASVSIDGTHIVASGTLDAKAKAFAEDDGLILGVSVPGLAVATPDASASVTIAGAANVSAVGAITLAADSTVKAEAEAGATPDREPRGRRLGGRDQGIEHRHGDYRRHRDRVDPRRAVADSHQHGHGRSQR